MSLSHDFWVGIRKELAAVKEKIRPKRAYAGTDISGRVKIRYEKNGTQTEQTYSRLAGATISDNAEVVLLPFDEGEFIVLGPIQNGAYVAPVSGGTTDPEIVRDTMAAALVAGSNITLTVNDAADTITIASTAGGTPTSGVDVRDQGVLEQSGATALNFDYLLTVTPNQTPGTAMVSVNNSEMQEFIRDVMGATTVGGTGITVVHDDAGNTLTLSTSGAPVSQIRILDNTSTERLITSVTGDLLMRGQRLAYAHNDIFTAINIAATEWLGAQHNHTSSSRGGTLPTTAIIDLAEFIRDTIAAFIVQGTSVTVVHDDLANTLTISSTATGGTGAAYTDEQVRDVMGVALVAGANVTITVDDVADTITIAAVSGSGGTTDHTLLTNIGTNTHPTIDTHLAATTAHGATGAVVGTTNTQTLQNKTLDTTSYVLPLDSRFEMKDSLDQSKVGAFQLSSMNASTYVSLSFPIASGTIVTEAGAQTLTNKTLTAPAITNPTGLVKANVGLGSVDNTTDADKPVSTAQATADDLRVLKAWQPVPFRLGTSITTTLATATNATGFSLTIGPNEMWMIDIHLFVGCSGTGGVKFACTIGNSYLLTLQLHGNTSTLLAFATARIDTTAVLNAQAFTTFVSQNGFVRITGTLGVTTNLGTTFQLQYAAGVAGQTATLRVGSYMNVERIL